MAFPPLLIQEQVEAVLVVILADGLVEMVAVVTF
jgi:hypothetical protein